MRLSGSPGSTVAGRDGADGTNNNRGSVPCGGSQNLGNSGNGGNGGGVAGEAVHRTFVAYSF